MALIECRELTRIYQRGTEEIRPLDGLDIDIDAGRFVALMGPSGSGKTTLLNLLAGIDRPTAGSLTIDGRAIHELSRGQLAAWRADNVGYIFQLYNLVPVLTAYENVELPLLLQPISRSERHRRVSAALEVVGISDRHAHYPRQMSGDLDRESATSVMRLLSTLNSEHGRTIIMVTHDPKTTEWSDSVVHLEKGKLIEERETAS